MPLQTTSAFHPNHSSDVIMSRNNLFAEWTGDIEPGGHLFSRDPIKPGHDFTFRILSEQGVSMGTIPHFLDPTIALYYFIYRGLSLSLGLPMNIR